MATINKKIIINKLHQKVGLSKRVLKTLIDELLEEIKKTLELGEETKIVRFGNFIPYETKKRKGRNLKNKKEVEIKPFKKIVFRVAPQFKIDLRNEKQ
ncbi:histone family protein DNA-binding protein [Thermodesulfobacterium geofontis OPF15]|jgi:integration host factor subunit alpha|uniref:Histone family protein DNA-binding protein n=1 Tax=Thermodesulfobacterium geofontis (strain OPF15) TaxID=795359 RepID=F8C4E1_THEGP|nr:HU family DNA-binding protein [Thermodesulfobacterium geofontis]AEH22645.1 histone family protein DNA-binding protein [Thermodesulfobacterium geofontis OPF15]